MISFIMIILSEEGQCYRLILLDEHVPCIKFVHQEKAKQIKFHFICCSVISLSVAGKTCFVACN